MREINDLKQAIVAACADDHVGLWEIVRIVERQDAKLDSRQVRATALDIVEELLLSGELEAGCPAKSGSDFEAWHMPAANIVTKLRQDWQPDHRPTIGEIAWFTTPVQIRKTA